nr:hypothetical protein GCM10020092_070500 [Actinoplanes digitatis]
MVDVRPTQENPVPGYRRMLEPAYWPYLLAAVLGCAALVEVAVREAGQPLTRPLGALLALAATAPIALVRAMPVVSAVLIAAVCLISPLIGYPPTVAVLVALGVACYVLGRAGPRPYGRRADRAVRGLRRRARRRHGGRAGARRRSPCWR